MSTEKLRNSTDLKVQSKSYYCFDKNGQPVFLPDENGTEEMSQSSSSTRNRSRSINSIADEELSYPSALEDGLIEYLPTTHARLLKQAINNFNRSPMTARDFLVARRMLIGSPNDLAQFIFENRPKLSKKKLGHFLGENNAFNQKVCDCLLLKYSFEGMSIDEALRSVVRLFCLPKETQQIDRIVEKFANVYFNQNVSRRHMPCRSADAAHVLVFSILMLNTDLHNKSVTPDKKMTKEQFINNNQGLNDGADFDIQFQTDLYDNIKNNEIKMDLADLLERDEVTFIAPVKAGWLHKQVSHPMGERFGSLLSAWQWSKRWFILNDGCLYYFKRPGDKNPRCIIPLENVVIERVGGSGSGNSTTTWSGAVAAHVYATSAAAGERNLSGEPTEWMSNPATTTTSTLTGGRSTAASTSSSSTGFAVPPSTATAVTSGGQTDVNANNARNGGTRSAYVHFAASVLNHESQSQSQSSSLGIMDAFHRGKDSCLLVITCVSTSSSSSGGVNNNGVIDTSSGTANSASRGNAEGDTATNNDNDIKRSSSAQSSGARRGVLSDIVNTLKSTKIDPSGAIVLTRRKRLVLKANSPQERDEWAAALQSQVVQFNPHNRPLSPTPTPKTASASTAAVPIRRESAPSQLPTQLPTQLPAQLPTQLPTQSLSPSQASTPQQTKSSSRSFYANSGGDSGSDIVGDTISAPSRCSFATDVMDAGTGVSVSGSVLRFSRPPSSVGGSSGKKERDNRRGSPYLSPLTVDDDKVTDDVVDALAGGYDDSVSVTASDTKSSPEKERSPSQLPGTIFKPILRRVPVPAENEQPSSPASATSEASSHISAFSASAMSQSAISNHPFSNMPNIFQRSPWATYATVSHAGSSQTLTGTNATSEGGVEGNTAAGASGTASGMQMRGARRLGEHKLTWDTFLASIPSQSQAVTSLSFRQGSSSSSAAFLKTRSMSPANALGLPMAHSSSTSAAAAVRLRSTSTLSGGSAHSANSSGKGSADGTSNNSNGNGIVGNDGSQVISLGTRRSSRGLYMRNSFTSEYRTPIRSLGSFSSVSSFSVSSCGSSFGSGSNPGSRRGSSASMVGGTNEPVAFTMPPPIVEGWLMRRIITPSEVNSGKASANSGKTTAATTSPLKPAAGTISASTAQLSSSTTAASAQPQSSSFAGASERSIIRLEGTMIPAIPMSPATLEGVGNDKDKEKEKEKEKILWRKLYFVLYPDFEGGGTTLFFYVKAQDALRMKTKGLETQRGFLRMSAVKSIVDSQIEGRFPYLDVITSDGIWRLAEEGPEKASTSLSSWARALTAASSPTSVVCGRL